VKLITISREELRAEADSQARAWCAELEAGDILYFPETPIAIPADDLAFLLGQQQKDSSLHKNIAYKPQKNEVSGLDDSAGAEGRARLTGIMANYSSAVTNFLKGFLSPYDERWKLDYASFRPQEEESRNLPLRRRNDLLHTDAFPTRPTNGARILRFFNNINPSRTRNWMTTETFAELAPKFAPREIALPTQQSGLGRGLRSLVTAAGAGKVMPALQRSPYDDFMMRFHNFLKENEAFQRDCVKAYWEFPPGSSWMVYTDTVSHAVLSGQYALEQTLLVAPEAMVRPEIAPLGVLEQLAGARLV
jgi:hypothetical protein